MPVLSAAVTVLALYGGPGLPGGPYTHSPAFSARTYTSTFTRLRLTVPGAPYGSFTGKTASSSETKFVTDSVRIYLTEGPVADIDLDVSDALIPVITESAYAALAKEVSDTLTPRVSDVVNTLSKSGTVPKTVSDTITLRITEGINYAVSVSVSDSLKPVITESSNVEKADEKTVSDTITLVATESLPLLTIFAANVSLNVLDTITFRVNDSSSLKTAGEVDRISIRTNPTGRIRIVRE